MLCECCEYLLVRESAFCESECASTVFEMFELCYDVSEFTTLYVLPYLICSMCDDVMWDVSCEEVFSESLESFGYIVGITFSDDFVGSEYLGYLFGFLCKMSPEHIASQESHDTERYED